MFRTAGVLQVLSYPYPGKFTCVIFCSLHIHCLSPQERIAFFQIPPHDEHPWLSLTVPTDKVCIGLSPTSQCACRAYEKPPVRLAHRGIFLQNGKNQFSNFSTIFLRACRSSFPLPRTGRDSTLTKSSALGIQMLGNPAARSPSIIAAVSIFSMMWKITRRSPF